jgi:hypothetical protein
MTGDVRTPYVGSLDIFLLAYMLPEEVEGVGSRWQREIVLFSLETG